MPSPNAAQAAVPRRLIAAALLAAAGLGLVLSSDAERGAGTPLAPAALSEVAPPAPGIAHFTLRGAVDEIPDGVTGRRNELLASVYVPTRWPRGRANVVLIQHGGHTPCLDGAESWPCSRPGARTPSYAGYGYLAAELVRRGHVVLSISANATVGSADVAASPSVFNHYARLLIEANDAGTGPLGGLLKDRLDLTGIDLIGHSRGGDAVAQYAGTHPAQPPLIPVRRLVLLAPVRPVDFNGRLSFATRGAPALIVTGSCDGDAGRDGHLFAPGFDAPGSRRVTITGANHNFYNTVWTPGTGVPDATDDASRLADPACASGSPTRLDPAQQQARAARLIGEFLS